MGDDDMEGAHRLGAGARGRPPCVGQGNESGSLTLLSPARSDYGFEYSDDEPEEEDVDIENQYYTAKGAPRAQCERPECGHCQHRLTRDFRRHA